MMQLPIRQFEVLSLLARGMPNKQIAHELKIQESTVKIHVRELMSKLKCGNRVQLALTYHNIDWRA